ncbi:MAG: ketoacyl-ACP synthase III [Deltaproteobacteria bacterium]|nr:ketoacyl-ACP synthase III [Deltaproteobacteria bacterium]MBI3293584.1 ketoacyl-ACP synthase III [Deltaproteobacteria bacterium]
MSAYYSEIIGSGCAFPDRVVTNNDLAKFIDTSDEWIRTRTGIEERRLADRSKGETTLTFAHQAAVKALEMAHLSGEQIDMIVMGTVTPDTVMPCTANQIQAKIGATRAFTFDLQAACSGFLYGYSIADQYIRTGTIERALVLGGETLSTVMNWQDRSTCVLFGDGAGGVVLQRTTSERSRVIATKLFSDGRLGEILSIPHGYGKVPPHVPEYRNDHHKVQMRGNELFKVAVRNMVDAASQVLWENQLKTTDVDFFIFHQANLRIIDMCAKSLDVPREKMWLNLQKYGNTSAATLPSCLDEAWRSGRVKKGDLILMVTFGGGLTWATTLVRL